MSADSELRAVVELLVTFFLDWRYASLAILLTIAAVSDIGTHRIPNTVVLVGLVIGCACCWLLPHGPRQGVLFPIEGIAVGFAIFLPLYVMRAMGAGDVKLMAMVGAFVGPGDAFYAALATMLVGGVFAIGYVLVNGTAARLYRNLMNFLYGSVLGVLGGGGVGGMRIDTNASAGRLPYGASIAIGSIGFLLLQHMGLL